MLRTGRITQDRAQWVRRLAKAMPFYRHLGLKLTRIGYGRAEMTVNVTRRLTQDAGVAHGGVAASMIDSAVGLALCSMLRSRELIATVELKVNFLQPARPGLLKAKGRIISKGKRLAVGEAEVRDRHGTMVAKGLVTYMILGQLVRAI